MFLEYAEALIGTLFEAYKEDPKNFKKSINLQIPPPLTASFPAVNKQEFVASYMSR